MMVYKVPSNRTIENVAITRYTLGNIFHSTELVQVIFSQ